MIGGDGVRTAWMLLLVPSPSIAPRAGMDKATAASATSARKRGDIGGEVYRNYTTPARGFRLAYPLPTCVAMRVYDSKELIGRAVIDAAGQALGAVSGMLLDREDWKVAALMVKLRKEAADAIGVERGRFRAAAIAIPTHLVMGAGDTVV